jgi:hypothetical protein
MTHNPVSTEKIISAHYVMLMVLMSDKPLRSDCVNRANDGKT